MSVVYAPTDSTGWTVLVSGSAVLLVQLSDLAAAVSLWDAVRSADPVQSSLDVLTRGGLTSTPAFAIAVWSGEPGAPASVVARGDAGVVVTAGGATAPIDGRTVSTWLEQRIENVSAITLGTVGEHAVLLPLDSGIAFATFLQVGIAGEDAPAQAAPARANPVAVPATPVAVPLTDPILPLPEVTAVAESTITELPDGDAAATGYAHLFEETVVRSIEDAAVRPPEDVDHETRTTVASDVPVSTGSGDHDGLTVMSGDLAELRRARRTRPVSREPQPAEPKFFLDLSVGGREPLLHSVIIGRSPTVTKASSGQVPRLISIPGDQDISRNHAQLTLEGGTVVVTDLHSRNGTSVILPGKAPQALRAGEPTPVIRGTVVDLGGGVRLTVVEES